MQGEREITKNVESEKPVRIMLNLANGETESLFLNTLGREAGGGRGLHHFFDHLREFGHSGSSIDKIGHGWFVANCREENGGLTVTGVDFVPWGREDETGITPAPPGHYRLTGAERLIRGIMDKMYEIIEREGDETGKRNYIGDQNEWRRRSEEAVRKYYQDAREGVIELDLRTSGEFTNLRYSGKKVDSRGRVMDK